jgi:hypothetical protein
MIIKDDFGKDFEIRNLARFIDHIEKYHTVNGEGDGSIHTEDEFVFRITKEFYLKVLNLKS